MSETNHSRTSMVPAQDPKTAVDSQDNRVGARIRFQFALVLYLGWLGYLAWQVAITRFPDGPAPVLSRSQWAGTDAEVVGVVRGPDELEIREILHAPADLPIAIGKTITVQGLDVAQRAPKMTPEAGGELWLVPLRKRGDGFLVAPIPSAPGYRAGGPGEEIGRIYLYTERLKLHARGVRQEVFGDSSKSGIKKE